MENKSKKFERFNKMEILPIEEEYSDIEEILENGQIYVMEIESEQESETFSEELSDESKSESE